MFTYYEEVHGYSYKAAMRRISDIPGSGASDSYSEPLTEFCSAPPPEGLDQEPLNDEDLDPSSLMLDGLPIDEPPPDYPPPKDYSTPPQKPNPKIQTKSKPKSKPKWTLIDTYYYYDGAGTLIYKVDKFLIGDKKQFIPSRYENGQWFKGIQDIQRLPYNFMAVEKAKTVFIVEGEKDVNTLTRLGLVGSCNSGGAGNWPDEITKYFKGKKIVLLPDNDKPGLAHADSVGRKLHSIAKAIKIISLPDLAEKGDVTDWVKAGGTKERLLELVKQGKVWTPG
ncbi:MAG: hypothetical protein GY718_12020, partial [Lentisphaerae bacterium]|nr:hypothetical protein [Lentisphaerota bacterium]